MLNLSNKKLKFVKIVEELHFVRVASLVVSGVPSGLVKGFVMVLNDFKWL